MPIFFDDFERANGAPGGSWSNVYGTVSIVAGSLVSSGGGVAAYTGVSDNHRSEVSAHVLTPAAGQGGSGVIARMTGTGLNGYCFFIYNNWSNWTVYLRDGGYSNGNTLGSWTFPGTPNPYIELKLIWDDGDLRAYVDGVERIAITNTLYILGTYCGLFLAGSNAPVLDFSTVGGAAVSFTVTPNPVGNYGTPTVMTATGGNTSWTPGTPGSPAFTVDHGTISGQVVASAVSATFTYDPGLFLGTAIFTDPSSGAQAYVLVTSNAGVVPIGGAGDTWSPYATLVQHTGEYNEPNTLLTDQTTVIAAGAVDGLVGMWPDWDSGSPWPPTKIGAVQALANIYAAVVLQQAVGPVAGTNLAPLLWRLDELRLWLYGGQSPTFGTQIGNTQTTLKADLAAIQGAGGVSLATLAAAMVGLARTSDLGGISDALDSIQGAGGVSLATLAAALSDLRGVGGHSLADILAALADVSPDLSPVTSAISALRGDSTSTIRETQIKATAAQTEAASISLALAALTTTDHLTLADVLSAISALAGGMGTATAGPPVWPGADHRTLLTSHALADELVIAGPLHGVIVTINGSPSGAGFYDFGGTRSWQHVGAVTFGDDEGHFERPDSLGLVNQVICPRSMAVASTCTFRVNAGWTGTARGWRIS